MAKILDEKKTFRRDNRLLIKALFISLILCAVGWLVVWLEWNDFLSGDNYHQYRATKGVVLFSLLILVGLYGLFYNLSFLIKGGPELVISNDGFTIYEAWRVRHMAWRDVGPFSYDGANFIKADILSSPGQKFKIRIFLYADKAAICDALNRHIATAQGLDISAIRTEEKKETLALDAAAETRSARGRIARQRLSFIFTRVVIWGLVLFLSMILLRIINRPLLQSYPQQLAAIFVNAFFGGIIVLALIAKRVYPLPDSITPQAKEPTDSV